MMLVVKCNREALNGEKRIVHGRGGGLLVGDDGDPGAMQSSYAVCAGFRPA